MAALTTDEMEALATRMDEQARDGFRGQATADDLRDGATAIRALISAWLFAENAKVSERDAHEKAAAALRQKDAAMSVLFDRMHAANIDFSDLIP